jgi:hypothetical protein
MKASANTDLLQPTAVILMNISPNAGLWISTATGASGPSQNSPLINYTLKGLQNCWLSEHGRWSHIYHLDGRSSPNESVPQSDVFYTLNVLLGMSRLVELPDGIDVSDIFRRNVVQLTMLPVPTYAFGMALWAAAELDLDIPEEVARRVRSLLMDSGEWEMLRAQDLGMLLTGIVAQARKGRTDWHGFAGPLFSFLWDRYHSESGLFFDAPSGFRRRFASFATQIYLSIACYHYGEFAGSAEAIAAANACARKLIDLQGPRGEWPWFFDARSGRVLDFYEVYSVHQYGMAPALLELAERHNVRGAREALIKGFNWVLGENQLGQSMLVPELNLSVRSQVRKAELLTKTPRVLRAVKNAYFGISAGLIDSSDVSLRLECRSYELGWILWSFGQRSDLPELTDNRAFTPLR